MPIVKKIVTPVELYVKAYFRTTGRKKIGPDYVRKALALVDQKLGNPCCTDPDATINFHTRFDNDFTNTIRMMLAGLPKQGNVASLNRTKTLLNNFLTPPCCD